MAPCWLKEVIMSRAARTIIVLTTCSLLIAMIEVVLVTLSVPSYIAPKPSDIWLALRDDPNSLAVAWAVTVSEAAVGLTIALVVSSLLAALTVFLPGTVAKAINNFGIAVQSTPLLAIAPLLSLWLGQSFAAKAAAAALVCFFPLLTGWLTGIRSVSRDYMQLFESLGANSAQTLKQLLVPMALPYFFGGIRVAVPLALLGAIVAEFIGASEGIGFRILSNSYYLRTAHMFAYVILAALTGWLLSALIVLAEKRILFWHGHERVT